MASGFLTLAQRVQLCASPLIKLETGLPSVRKVINVPKGIAIHYSDLLARIVTVGVMNQPPSGTIKLHLNSPPVIATIVSIWMTGQWPTEEFEAPLPLIGNDVGAVPPMDTTPATLIDMIFEVVRVADSLLMKTDLIDSVVSGKLTSLLRDHSVDRNILKTDHVVKVFEAGCFLSNTRELVAQWCARDYLVHSLELEKALKGGRGIKESIWELQPIADAHANFRQLLDGYSNDMLLRASLLGKGIRVTNDLVTGKPFKLPRVN